jgi:hypothetical protein
VNNSWQNTLNELNAYISANPDIVIKHDSIDIPENLRPGFYRLFDRVRQEIVQAELGELLDRAQILSNNYFAIEQIICKKHVSVDLSQKKAINQIKKTLSSPFDRLRDKIGFGGFKFDEITLDEDLNQSLSCPPKGLSRVLFEPLFNLLQDKISVDDFNNTIKDNIPSAFRQLYHSGYEKWIILSLLKALKIKTAFKSSSNIVSFRQKLLILK